MSYRIQHINLGEVHTLTFVPVEHKGQYIVLWWHQLPLGDFYIEISDKVDDDKFRKKIVEAISASIFYYTGTAETVWMEYLIQNDFYSFQQWIKNKLYDDIIDEKNTSLPVSVIICTRNRAAFLNRCLQSLLCLQFKAAEIIVVDNAPDNDDVKLVVQNFGNVRYILEPRKGLDIARNAGVRSATNDIVTFIDDDALPHPYWLLRIWQTFHNEDIAALTGLVFPLTLDTPAQVLFERYWSFNRGYKSKIYDKGYINKNTPVGAPVWEIGAGVNMAFRKKVFNDVGLFDELLDAGAAGCNGDSEMWFRILASGYKICYNPKAVVYHEHREDLPGLERQIFNYMKGNTAAALIQKKYHPESAYENYIINNLKTKVKKFLFGIIKRRWLLVKIMRLELKGILAGVIYYHKTK